MPTDLLPGYRWDARTSRYHSNATGQFVARQTILDLMESHVNAAASRMATMTTAYFEKRLSAATWVEQMRIEQRRLTLQCEALGMGGWDRMGAKQNGRAGRDLRDQYAKIGALAQEVADGKVTLAQALTRVNEISGSGRAHFYQAERDSIQRSSSNMLVIERRVLGFGNHCKDCVGFYEQGWQLIGVLPAPCTDSVCRGLCHCGMMRKEVPASEVNEWIGSKRR